MLQRLVILFPVKKHRLSTTKIPASALENLGNDSISLFAILISLAQTILGFKKSSLKLYKEDFSKPKIVYPNMTKYMPFVYDKDSYLTNQKCFIITGKSVAYLTAFFNSSLFKFCFRDSFPELQGGTRELSKIFFDKIPVKMIPEHQNIEFEKKILELQQEYNKERAIEIDQMIFDLYKLSEEERQLIGYIEIQ